MRFTYETDIVERFRAHLPETKEIALIVLKGHLLVEELINDLLEEELPNPITLRRGRFTFFQRLLILDALIPWNTLELRADALSLVEKLNTLRNRLAHHLEPADLNRCIREFLDSSGAYAIDREPPPEDAIPELLSEGVILTLSALVGFGIMLKWRRISQGRSSPECS
jgi:hypothetical protein